MKRTWTILAKELRDTIRDRRTLMAMVLAPIILMPLILVGSVKLQEWSQRSEASHVVRLNVTGRAGAPELVKWLEDDKMIETASASEPDEALREGKIDASLSIPDDFERQLAAEKPIELDLRVNSTKRNSASSVDKVELSVKGYSESVVALRLENEQVEKSVLSGIDIRARDIATEKEKGGTFLGYLLPMFLVIFSLLGGMYTAMDISAGEKERRTLEALLLTPASRTEIVLGKFFAVASVSIVTVALSVASIFVTGRFISGSLGQVELGLDLKAAVVMVPVAILLAAMFAALLLAVSIYARSYKEAQNYVMPLYLLAVVPVLVANSISVKGTPLLFVIPGFNAVVLFREVLIGEFVALNIVITIVSMMAFTALSILYAVKIYSRDDVMVEG